MSRDLSTHINKKYTPFKAFLIHKTEDREDVYIESYDINEKGKPVNAHPLTIQECTDLALCLQSGELANNFLTPKGLLPKNILKINNHAHKSYVMWYTESQNVQLNFTELLEIPNGRANVPSLLWKASKNYLSVYALNLSPKESPVLSTPLYQAPFFNIYDQSEIRDGNVCMGNVDLDFVKTSSLEEFIEGWESAFWNSRFSHMNRSVSPIKSNIVEFWKNHVNVNASFPLSELKTENITIKTLID
nr:PRTRC system protein B [uncultured Pedobacter sp.]